MLRETTAALDGIEDEDVHRDYWLTRCLHALSVSTGGTGRMFDGHPNPALAESVCAFGGGTSLVSAWDVTRRYSEDLDILCLMDTATTRNALGRPHNQITRVVLQACGASKADATVDHRGLARYRQTLVPLNGDPVVLKVESTVEEADHTLFAPRRVMSLMGRHATPDQLAEFGELGGFVMPCVVPAYTVVNKLDALHRRTVDPVDVGGIALRGRDLYDLAAVARSGHADEARRRVPALAARASESEVRKPVPRPEGGYGRSDVFAEGTAAYEAVRRGYSLALTTSWDDNAPAFEEAVVLAASLDLY